LANFVRAAALATVVAAGAAGAAVILEDGFTDPVASHGQWVNSDPENMTVGVEGGSLTLANRNDYPNEYLHPFTTKPSVFTITFVLKSVSGNGNGGVMFCRGEGPSGYFLTIDDGMVTVFKFTATTNSISWNSIYRATSFDLNPSSENTLAVSKNGSTFNLFVNGAYQGSFTDTQYGSGDVSLVALQQVTAVFGAFLMTNEFTEGKARTSFKDNFNGNGLRYWQDIHSGAPTVSEGNGVLTMKTNAGDYARIYVDLELTNFAAKVEVSHRSGSTSPAYGIVLIGEGIPIPGRPNEYTVPMVYFGIRGDRKFGVWKTGSGTTLSEVIPAIKGAGVGGLLFVDTIEVKRMSGSSTYEFLANGTTLTEYPVVDFKIVGIGVFSEGNLEVAFDNFSAEQEGTTSIKRGAQVSRRPAGAVVKKNGMAFYDLRGRKRYTVTAAQAIDGRMPVRAAGVYVNENGREVRVRKNGR
jgi:hypothetical protein